MLGRQTARERVKKITWRILSLSTSELDRFVVKWPQIGTKWHGLALNTDLTRTKFNLCLKLYRAKFSAKNESLELTDVN